MWTLIINYYATASLLIFFLPTTSFIFYIRAHSLNLPTHSNENKAIDVTTIFIIIPYLIVSDTNARYTSAKVKLVELTKRNRCWFNLVVFRPKASTIMCLSVPARRQSEVIPFIFYVEKPYAPKLKPKRKQTPSSLTAAHRTYGKRCQMYQRN